MGGLQNALNSASSPLRILFKRGQEVADVLLRSDFGPSGFGHIGAWGSGPRPILRSRRGQNMILVIGTPVSRLTITDIDFRSDWDASTETGIADPSPLQFLANSVHCHYTIANCDFSGWNDLWLAHQLAGGAGSSSTMVFANNVVTNWRSYGIFIHDMASPNSRLALVGCRIAQHEDALNGGPNSTDFYNNQGPLRYADNSDVYIGSCDFFSRNGWSSAPPDLADQPCIRVNFKGVSGLSAVIERCVFEGGFGVMSFVGESGDIIEAPGNYLIDKALLIATSKSAWEFIACEYGGLTVRNTIGIMPDVLAHHPNDWRGALHFIADNPTPENVSAPMAVYSSSFVSLRSTSTDPGHDWQLIGGPGQFLNVTAENNILHAPGLDTPVTPHGPVDLTGNTIPGVQPRYKGVRYDPHGYESGNLGGSVGPGGSFTLSYPAGTTQGYWQAIQTIDTRHALRIGGTPYHASLGEFSVSFEGAQIRITNTSGATWPGGSTWNLKLDRKSQIPPMDTSRASPPTLPLPVAMQGSPAFGTAGTGGALSAYDDFFGNVRGASASGGAVNP
jgi:hypothetical protein